MQVSGSGLGATIGGTYAKEGASAFYKGIAWAWGREGSYASIKLGAYAPVRNALGAGKDSPIYLKVVAGAITGGVGSLVGNPFDVLKTMAQTNGEVGVSGEIRRTAWEGSTAASRRASCAPAS